MDAPALVRSVRADLEPVRQRLLAHPYVARVEAGAVDLTQMRPFAGEQHAIISSDLRSVAHVLSRTGDPFFAAVLDGERVALEALRPFAAATGLDQAGLDAYEPQAGAHAYAAYMAWLGAYGSAAEVAAAYLVNFQAWGENCARLAAALRGRFGLAVEQVRFFELFAASDEEFEPQALEVIRRGLEAGVPERALRRAPRLLQGYELLYWDTLAAGLG